MNYFMTFGWRGKKVRYCRKDVYFKQTTRVELYHAHLPQRQVQCSTSVIESGHTFNRFVRLER